MNRVRFVVLKPNGARSGSGVMLLAPGTREKMAEVAIRRLRAGGVLRRGEGLQLIIPK